MFQNQTSHRCVILLLSIKSPAVVDVPRQVNPRTEFLFKWTWWPLSQSRFLSNNRLTPNVSDISSKFGITSSEGQSARVSRYLFMLAVKVFARLFLLGADESGRK